MKSNMKRLGSLVVCLGLAGTLAACGSTADSAASESVSVATSTGSEAASSSSETAAQEAFDYSQGLTDEGLWEGITALDYVTLPEDYMHMPLTDEQKNVTDDAVQSQIDSILTSYATATQITDRAVEDGDKVNIDYVGSVDGVPFDGGNTQGAGTSVTAGSTEYIDDFLTQIIGHTPGETFDVNVTFPDDYGVDTLNGKDAVFSVTINYIEGDTVNPELNDAFVEANLLDSYNVKTVDDLRTTIKADLREQQLYDAALNYLNENSTVTDPPQSLIDYETQYMLAYYSNYASYYGVDLDTYLSSQMGVANADELVTQNADQISDIAKQMLVLQAVIEDQKTDYNEAQIQEYFGAEDSAQYVDHYGKGYVSMTVRDYYSVLAVGESAAA